MNCNYHCISCIFNRQFKKAQRIEDVEARGKYLSEALRIIADNALSYPAPCIIAMLEPVKEKYIGKEDLYASVKTYYNNVMLGRQDGIMERIRRNADPLKTALLFSRAGNYIDFGAMHSVDDEKLESILSGAENETLDEALYKELTDDLSGAKRLLLLTDNCGEIVLDKLLVTVIKERYPNLEISVLVRGEPALNDATPEDAAQIGLDKLAYVTGNGNGVPGTWLPKLSDEARGLIDSADVIIAKGQANFETFYGNGYNAYYLLLCKCQRFVELFGVPSLTGMFVHERRAER